MVMRKNYTASLLKITFLFLGVFSSCLIADPEWSILTPTKWLVASKDVTVDDCTIPLMVRSKRNVAKSATYNIMTLGSTSFSNAANSPLLVSTYPSCTAFSDTDIDGDGIFKIDQIPLEMNAGESDKNLLVFGDSGAPIFGFTSVFDRKDEPDNILKFSFLSSGGSIVKTLLTFNQDGRIGIGTSLPVGRFHVFGDIKANGFLGTLRTPSKKLFLFQWGALDGKLSFRDRAGNNLCSSQSFIGNKTFVIEHPTKKECYLVHATLEGPENAVFYRGESHLVHGEAIIKLPSYFEALTDMQGRTVQLTKLDGFDKIQIKHQRGYSVYNGTLIVVSEKKDSVQKFFWEIKALRKGMKPMPVEPLKKDITVKGFGPYTYYEQVFSRKSL